MSELRSKYPQAQAWTFVLGTPTTSVRSKGPAGGVKTTTDTVGRQERNDTGSIGDSMGACCSSAEARAEATATKSSNMTPFSNNKENAGGDGSELAPVDSAITGGDAKHTACGGGKNTRSVKSSRPDTTGTVEVGHLAAISRALTSASSAAGPRDHCDTACLTLTANGQNGNMMGEHRCRSRLGSGEGGVLDETSLISPEPSLPSSIHLAADDVDHEFGDVEEGDAWLAKSLRLLRNGASVDVSQLTQISGVEECLQELLADRARSLKAMENLTMQLRRRETDAEKLVHDNKALAARLELGEQEKASLETRARAAAEEHRVDRGRWVAHKQELETRCVQLEGKDTQYRAALRKKDTEYNKLQDGMRRVVHKESRAGPRGIEATFELTPAVMTGDGCAPLGGLVNEKNRRRVEELEKENTLLRNMLVDLQEKRKRKDKKKSRALLPPAALIKVDVVELREYHDRHGDLVSAGRTVDTGDWDREAAVLPVTGEAIEGMPLDWLQRRLGDETARQIIVMRGALHRVLGEGDFADGAGVSARAGGGSEVVDEGRHADVLAQLKEARALLREQDAIMMAAIFDRPGAEAEIAEGRKRCVCGAGHDPDGMAASMIWESRERLEQEIEDLANARARLEQDKARFLEEAVKRDSKSFVFSCPSGTPSSPLSGKGGIGGGVDVKFSTPVHWHRHLAATGTLMVPSSPCPPAQVGGVRWGGGEGEGGALPLMTFTPPGASPDTARLLGEVGIKLGNISPYQ